MELDVEELEEHHRGRSRRRPRQCLPRALLEAKKGMGTVSVGGIVEIRSSDAGSRGDIPVWANKVGHEYLGVLKADEGYDRIFVRRGK